MTTETRNEAAERLREHMADFHGNCPWLGEDHIALLDEALASERLATVKRIRDRLLGPDSPVDALYERHTRAILDEEAARNEG